MVHKITQMAFTRKSNIKETLRSMPFRKGFDEAIAGRPFDYNYVDSSKTSDAWKYERGRLLGFVYKGKLKTGNRVENSAIEAYKTAKREHLIF